MAKEGKNSAVVRATTRRESILAIKFLGEQSRTGFQVTDLCGPGGPAVNATAARVYLDRAVKLGHVERQVRGTGWRFVPELLAGAALVQEKPKGAAQQGQAPPHQPKESEKAPPPLPLAALVVELRLLYHYLDLEVGRPFDLSMIATCFGCKLPGLQAFPYHTLSSARDHLNSVAKARRSLIERPSQDQWVLRIVPDLWEQERLTRRANDRPTAVAAVMVQRKQEPKVQINWEPIVIRCDPQVVLQVYAEYYGIDVMMHLGGDMFGRSTDDQRWMRGVLIYLYHEYTSMNAQEIGIYVGLKAVASINRWRNEIHSYRNHLDFRVQLDEIKQLILSKLEEPKAA